MRKYNKLVRDKVPEIIESKGEKALYHKAEEGEYWQKLKEKIKEEINEFEKDESIEELADVLEVIDSVIDYKKFDRDEIEKVKKSKFEKKGGFKDRIILDES